MQEGEGHQYSKDAGGEGAGGPQGVFGGAAVGVGGIEAETAAADRPRHHQAAHQRQPQAESLAGVSGLDLLGHHHGAAQQAAAAGAEHAPPGPGGQGPAAGHRTPCQQQGREEGGGQGRQMAGDPVGGRHADQAAQQSLEARRESRDRPVLQRRSRHAGVGGRHSFSHRGDQDFIRTWCRVQRVKALPDRLDHRDRGSRSCRTRRGRDASGPAPRVLPYCRARIWRICSFRSSIGVPLTSTKALLMRPP